MQIYCFSPVEVISRVRNGVDSGAQMFWRIQETALRGFGIERRGEIVVEQDVRLTRLRAFSTTFQGSGRCERV